MQFTRGKILGVAVFSAAIASGGVAGVILGTPASGSAATTPTTTTAPHAFRDGPGGMPFGGRHFGGPGASLDAAAKALGISSDTLKTDLRNGQTIAQVAKAKGVAVQKVISAMVADAKAKIDAQVSAGHLTSDQATKIESGLTTMITNLVNGTRPKPPTGAVPAPRAGHAGRFGGPGASLDAAAKALGISSDTLKTDLRNGQTIAQVAKAKGVAVQKVISAMVADAKAKIEAQVTAGHLTSDQATKIESGLTTMITNLVNGTRPKPPTGAVPGPGPFGFGGSGRGHWGPGNGNQGKGIRATGTATARRTVRRRPATRPSAPDRRNRLNRARRGTPRAPCARLAAWTSTSSTAPTSCSARSTRRRPVTTIRTASRWAPLAVSSCRWSRCSTRARRISGSRPTT